MSRVLVAGGGIVGLTTALALRHNGFDVTVAERAEEIRATGTSLGLWANALAVFEHLGVADQIAVIGRPGSMRFHDAAGRLIDTPGFAVEDHTYLLVDRPRLNAVLASALGRNTIRLGTRVARYQETADGVTVHFADGASEAFDLLVGADGLHSAVRAHLVPEAGAQPHPGHHVWRAVLPPGAVWVGDGVMTVGRHGCRGGYARTHDGGVYWLVSQFGSPAPTGTPKAEALHRARQVNDGLLHLIEATAQEQVLHNPIMVVPPLSRWTSRRVALAGDAAHAMSPHVTAGASLGVEDAAALARHLAARAVPEALAAYELERIPRYERVRALSEAVAAYRTPQEFARRYATFSHWMLNAV
ncbi:FAD-dependent monooxygenase [Kutzneria viridogrisea]|uniref:FAD-binding domain-containing protein n=2 Tax=Kutzneria TaxID=43356 RepID=W5WCB0_9PSEU|nr:FAD-dependent oxidoreductase [Kutzneria albida]AHH98146.1 hypothetical protein KALB_4784 [Kutzneria albida DSM 43870]MBA8924171.1 2-polyprenyl-6-methoxyphenol hydroxylase-like FAD-dependent oxidoreductase [Kutzneria viridogrisea]